MKINSLQGFYHTKCPPRQQGLVFQVIVRNAKMNGVVDYANDATGKKWPFCPVAHKKQLFLRTDFKTVAQIMWLGVEQTTTKKKPPYREALLYNKLLYSQLTSNACFPPSHLGNSNKFDCARFGVGYLLNAVATSTATATVAPTIGLLPMPRKPIISTCAGTDDEPAN